MNRDPGNDLIRVFILGLGQDGAAGGKGKRGREERPQSFTRCDHMRYIIIQCGREARSKRATVTLLQGGEKSGGNPLWNSRRARRTARRAFAHSDSTTWTCLASFFFSSRLFFFRLPKERKKESRPLSFLSFFRDTRNERQRFFLMPRDRLPIALASNVTCHDF